MSLHVASELSDSAPVSSVP